MQSREHAPTEPLSVEEAKSRFLDGDTDAAIVFLRKNPLEIAEFCLLIRDTYADTDRATPFIKLARLIEKLL